VTGQRHTFDTVARFIAQLNVGEWVERAACRGAGPRLWFPTTNGITAESTAARAICAECPVVDECRDYGVAHEPRWGIWGGLNAKERRDERRARKAAAVDPIGDLFARIAVELGA